MHEELMEQIVEWSNVERALREVIANRGAPGVDHMRVEELRAHVERHYLAIRVKLLEGRWAVNPVKRVEIPKPEGGIRNLGIPTALDRLIQQMVLQVLQPIFDPLMSETSFGFRPNRNAHQAVRCAQEYIKQGKDWVVDIDIAAFFDCVHHDILMRRIGQVIRDKRVLKLIGRFLRSGVKIGRTKEATTKGTPQGGPLSPLLGNIYLDALDRELEARELSFVRYADDCNIYVGSERAAERVFEGIVQWLAKKLRLEVNRNKSAVGRPWERKFLGFCIQTDDSIGIAQKSIERFKTMVRQTWKSCQALKAKQLRDLWRARLVGWWNYYRLADDLRVVLKLSDWIRRHIRKYFWLRWHDYRGRRAALKRLGIRDTLSVAYSTKGAWRMAISGTVTKALSNPTLRRYGFIVPLDLVRATP